MASINHIKRFYNKNNIIGVLGSRKYRTACKEESDETDLIALRAALQDRLTKEEMITLLGEFMSKNKSQLLARTQGRQSKARERAFAMYACHYYYFNGLLL